MSVFKKPINSGMTDEEWELVKTPEYKKIYDRMSVMAGDNISLRVKTDKLIKQNQELRALVNEAIGLIRLLPMIDQRQGANLYSVITTRGEVSSTEWLERTERYKEEE